MIRGVTSAHKTYYRKFTINIQDDRHKIQNQEKK